MHDIDSIIQKTFLIFKDKTLIKPIKSNIFSKLAFKFIISYF